MQRSHWGSVASDIAEGDSGYLLSRADGSQGPGECPVGVGRLRGPVWAWSRPWGEGSGEQEPQQPGASISVGSGCMPALKPPAAVGFSNFHQDLFEKKSLGEPEQDMRAKWYFGVSSSEEGEKGAFLCPVITNVLMVRAPS